MRPENGGITVGRGVSLLDKRQIKQTPSALSPTQKQTPSAILFVYEVSDERY